MRIISQTSQTATKTTVEKKKGSLEKKVTSTWTKSQNNAIAQKSRRERLVTWCEKKRRETRKKRGRVELRVATFIYYSPFRKEIPKKGEERKPLKGTRKERGVKEKKGKKKTK